MKLVGHGKKRQISVIIPDKLPPEQTKYLSGYSYEDRYGKRATCQFRGKVPVIEGLFTVGAHRLVCGNLHFRVADGVFETVLRAAIEGTMQITQSGIRLTLAPLKGSSVGRGSIHWEICDAYEECAHDPHELDMILNMARVWN